MAVLRAPQPTLKSPRNWGFGISHKKLFVVLVVAAVVLAVAVVVLAVRWPFREAVIVKSLEEAGSGKLEIRSFREAYFPYPGCVAEGVKYRLGASGALLATVDTLTIQSNFLELFAGHLRLIRADGLHVYVPGPDSKQKFSGFQPGSTGIDEIDVRNAVLTVPRNDMGKPAVEFPVHELKLGSINVERAIHFSAALSNPEPPGEITASGEFGPWENLQTPVSGDYEFENADLGSLDGIAGILSSQGKFSGVLQHINVSGKIKIPDFEVKGGNHPEELNSEFDAYVNGSNGDTFLTHVSSRFPKTTVASEGKIAGKAGQKGKTATINLETSDGRIEDILRLFTEDAKPPMAGELNFKGQAILPPGEVRFLKKVQMAGDFGISGGSFPHQTTQEKVDELSQNAQKDSDGKKKTGAKGKENDNAPPPPVVSDLKGHVELKNGVATFSNLSFYVPGAHAEMHGTYNLISEQIDMHGKLKMDSELSDESGGAKAVVLKILNPFFKRKHKPGSVVPVKIAGTYHNPSFGVDEAGAGERILSGKSIRKNL